MQNNKIFYSWMAVTAAVVMWGLSFLSIKVTVAVVPPMTQALLRLIIASVVLFLMLKVLEPQTKLNMKDVPMFLMAALLGVTVYFYLENNALTIISASSASLIIAAVPIMTILADAVVFKEPLTLRKVVSVCISFVGVYLIVGEGGYNGQWRGYLLMLGAAVSWVVYTLVTKSLFQKYSELAIVYYQSLLGTLTLLPFVLVEKTNWMAINLPISLNVVFLGVGCSALATYFYVIGIEAVGVSIASLMMNLVPVVAVVASFFILNERVTLLQLVGGICVIAAVCLCNLKIKYESEPLKGGRENEIHESVE